MGTGQRIAAVLAGAAWARLGARADQPLSQPERESLLADPEGAVQEERPRQSVATNGVVEPRAKRGVAMNGKEGHGWKVRPGRADPKVRAVTLLCCPAQIMTQTQPANQRRGSWKLD